MASGALALLSHAREQKRRQLATADLQPFSLSQCFIKNPRQSITSNLSFFRNGNSNQQCALDSQFTLRAENRGHLSRRIGARIHG